MRETGHRKSTEFWGPAACLLFPALIDRVAIIVESHCYLTVAVTVPSACLTVIGLGLVIGVEHLLTDILTDLVIFWWRLGSKFALI